MAKRLIIFGDGSVGGGEFGKVRVYGEGIFQTDILAESIKVYGSATFNGKVESDEIQIYGSAAFNEPVTCSRLRLYGSAAFEQSGVFEELTIRGDGEFNRHVTVDSIKNSGTLVVNGCLIAREVKSYGVMQGAGKFKVENLLSAGVLETKGEIEGEKMIIKGAIHNANLINGEDILIELNDQCQCQSIGASKLMVKSAKCKRRKSLFTMNKNSEKTILTEKWLANASNKVLIAEEIEGDNLELNLTKAKVVRGEKIKIGALSKIGMVEYSMSLEIDESAEVLQQVRS